ncbi:MAG TPA: BrnT family toxin [Hyphomicrobiales bacterium]|nr:BrnT family toxin [Hyphomicrobiales bacterium]
MPKVILWDEEKNRRLIEERGLSFEAVEAALEDGRALDDRPHPNQEKYRNQRILVVEIDGYACVVPYVDNPDSWFLKTIYPSRKAQRIYLGG